MVGGQSVFWVGLEILRLMVIGTKLVKAAQNLTNGPSPTPNNFLLLYPPSYAWADPKKESSKNPN